VVFLFPSNPEADKTAADRLASLTAPRSTSVRVALTKDGALFTALEDRFTEEILDLHWRACLVAVLSPRDDQLGEFVGITIEGHDLATSLDELIAGCLKVATS
jgi:hypothetical protein